jgi:DNA processing protein
VDERLCHLGFSVFPGIGPVKLKILIQQLGSAENAWKGNKVEFKKAGIDKVFLDFEQFRLKFSPIAYEKQLIRRNIKFIAQIDKEYPKKLLSIEKPPVVLYCKGDIRVLNLEPSVGIVGTRKTTQYGREVTELITGNLVNSGFIVVSGLAMGVDAIAHKTTIDAGGKTVAVLGCGIDCCSPSENQNLYDEIIKKGGVIVSELPMSHPPTKGSFPSRNRIIAGLSDAVLVTEGAEDSGALITADYALKSNRSVFAVPGPITSGMSKGPYKLISQGAKLVTSAQDILNNFQFPIFNFQTNLKMPKFKGTRDEEMVLEIIEHEAMQFDEIARKTKLSSQKLGTILSILELRGVVQSNGGTYSIVYT